MPPRASSISRANSASSDTVRLASGGLPEGEFAGKPGAADVAGVIGAEGEEGEADWVGSVLSVESMSGVRGTAARGGLK